MSAIRLTCPECDATVRLSRDVSPGKKVRCPKCDAVFSPDNSGDLPRRSKSREKQPVGGVHPALIVVPAVAAALLVYGGTVAAVIIKEKRANKDDQVAASAPVGSGPVLAKGPNMGPGASGAAKGNSTIGLNVGNIAPDIDGEDIDGQRFKLSDYRGKVVVIDFWGNW